MLVLPPSEAYGSSPSLPNSINNALCKVTLEMLTWNPSLKRRFASLLGLSLVPTLDIP